MTREERMEWGRAAQVNALKAELKRAKYGNVRLQERVKELEAKVRMYQLIVDQNNARVA